MSSSGTKTPTTIYDSDGTARSGYIQNGITYYSDGSRISEGSTVTDNSGREWKMTNGSGVLTGTNYGLQGRDYDTGGGSSNAYSDAVDDYATEQKKLLNSLRSAYDTSRNSLEAQRPVINQYADEMANTADTGYYQSLPDLYKAMEAGGQRGGENITAMSSANTARQNGLNTASQYRANQLAGISTALQNLDSQQASDEASALSNLSSDTYTARLAALKQAVADKQAAAETARADAINTIGAYSNDYRAYSNQLANDGDTSNDWLIPYVEKERNEKLANQSTLSNLSASEVRSLYKSGLIDYSTAQSLLQRLGVAL